MSHKEISIGREHTILVGDCRERLAQLPPESLHCCVTSPPYFGLRDYGSAGQIGLEPQPDVYVQEIVEVFRLVHKTLQPDGTLWLNLGDSYANDGKWGGHTGGKHAKALHASPIGRNKRYTGLKPKDLIGIPWRVAFALQADGWYLRRDIIWHKPNPMPESVFDRCTSAHEYIFHFSKSPIYYYDAESVKEPAVSTHKSGNGFKRSERLSYLDADGARGNDAQWTDVGGTRNRRSVWTVPAKPFKGAHFATFPPALIEPCVLAGCPRGGTVLDPFGGAGTTGLVALQNHRRSISIEINPAYADMAAARIRAEHDRMVSELLGDVA